MMDRPRISVIIPAYNAAQTLGFAIDSVLTQTFDDLELLVIDDGSTDDTTDIVKSRGDNRLRYVRTSNQGVSAARNRGLDLSSGDLVAFLDADDAWRPLKLERQHLLLSGDRAVGLCFTSAAILDDQRRRRGLDVAQEYDDYSRALLGGNIVTGGGSSVMARRSLIEQAGGFDQSLSQCADWDMWLRMSVVTKFRAIDDPLVLYRRAPDTMSSDPGLLEQDTFAMLGKFYASPASADYEFLRRRVYAEQWMVCAGSHLHAGRMRDALRCLTQGLRSDPRTGRRVLTLPARWATRARLHLADTRGSARDPRRARAKRR